MKKYLTQIFQGTEGGFSSKRTVTLISTFLILLGFIVNLFTDLSVDEHIFEAVAYIVIAGLGFTGAEKFAPKKIRDESENSIETMSE